MTDYELYSLFIKLIGFFVLFCSLFIGIIQIKRLIKHHSENHEWNRRIETQKAVDAVRDMDLQKLNENLVLNIEKIQFH